MFELPNWLPRAIRVMAETYGYGDEVSSRVLTNPVMKKVWADLHGDDIKLRKGALDNVEGWQKIYDGKEYSEKELAAAALYASCLQEVRSDFVATSAKVEKDIAKWRDIADTCRMIRDGGVNGAARGNKELAAALDRTAVHFDALAEWLANRSGPRWLGKGKRPTTSTGKRVASSHSEITRARVSAIIFEADRLYEKKLRTTLSRLSSVALAESIDCDTIRNWRNLMGGCKSC